jgi:hypothetical protein
MDEKLSVSVDRLAELEENARRVALDEAMSDQDRDAARLVLELIHSGRRLERQTRLRRKIICRLADRRELLATAVAPFAKAEIGQHELERAVRQARTVAAVLKIQPQDV